MRTGAVVYRGKGKPEYITRPAETPMQPVGISNTEHSCHVPAQVEDVIGTLASSAAWIHVLTTHALTAKHDSGIHWGEATASELALWRSIAMTHLVQHHVGQHAGGWRAVMHSVCNVQTPLLRKRHPVHLSYSKGPQVTTARCGMAGVRDHMSNVPNCTEGHLKQTYS